MKKILTLTFLIAFSTFSFGQINWTYSKSDAVELAQKEGKVIVMDFWAIWCGPCKQMDTKLWDNPEVTAVSDKFVAYKVDVDSDRTTPMQYKIQGIPRVIIITPSGQVLWDRTGFGTAVEYIEVLKNLPDDISDIIAADQALEEDKTEEAYFDAGMSYQALAQNTDHNEVKSKLLSMSSSYLQKVQKKSKDDMTIQLAKLNQIYNTALAGNAKRALKQITKLTPNSNTEEFSHFVRAYCHKCQGDLDALKSEKSKITDPKLLAELKN